MADSDSTPSNRPSRRETEDTTSGATTRSSSDRDRGDATRSSSSSGRSSSSRAESGAGDGGSGTRTGGSGTSTATSAPTGSGSRGSTSAGSSTRGSSSHSSPSFVDKVKLAVRNASRNLDDGRPVSASRTGTGTAGRSTTTTRRARLRLTRIDPWSVAKMAFLLSVALGVVTVVAVSLVWGVLDAAGVWDSINAMVYQVIGSDSNTDFDVENYLGTSRVIGFTLIVAGVDVLLLTAIATLAAFLYNLGAALLGGVEVTLAEDGR